MRTPLTPAELGFEAADRRRLSRDVAQAVEARCLRRFQAVLFVAEGRLFGEAAHLTGLSLRSAYRLARHYLQSRTLDVLREAPTPF